MKPKLIVINSTSGLAQLELLIRDAEFVAYDTETTGVHKGAEVIGFSVCFSEDKSYYVILASWNPTGNCLDYNRSPSYKQTTLDILNLLKAKKLIMHNAIFDCRITEEYFNVSLVNSLHTDTMILAHITDENRRVGLKELGKTLFGESADEEQKLMKDSVIKNGGKLTKNCYEIYKADSQLMAKYGAKDAWLTYRLFTHLVPILFDQGLDKFFYEDESMPLLKGPTYELNTTGLQIDINALLTLKKTLEAECEEDKAFIYKEIAPYIKDKYPGTNKKNTFNIGASQQLSWLLFGKYQLEFNNLTKAGKTVCRELGLPIPYKPSAKRDFIATCERQKGEVYAQSVYTLTEEIGAKKIREPWAYTACDKETLTKLAPKYEWIKRLLDYQRKQKILNTYVEGIEERVQYGVIHPSFLQHGTTSGRYSSRDPNFQNLPRDDKRVKSCIVARPGKIFVGADYSQLEPRVFAYFSKDEKLLKAFSGSEDFYSVIGMEVFDKTDCTPHKEGQNAFGVKYKKLRDLAKVVALATVYGATAHKLAKTTGKSIDDTQDVIDNYLERFPGVHSMMKESHNQAKSKGFVTNLFGRPRRMPEAMKITKIYGTSDLPYEARNMLNLAVNHQIQSTGASIVNRAAIKFHEMKQQADMDCKIVLQVHDSLIVECSEDDVNNVKVLLQEAMENTVELEGIRLEAVPKAGKTLADV